MKTVEENGLLSDSQVGFRPGYGCRDAIMIANTLVEKGLNLGFEDMRLMFVDISPAQDSRHQRSDLLTD